MDNTASELKYTNSKCVDAIVHYYAREIMTDEYNDMFDIIELSYGLVGMNIGEILSQGRYNV